MMHRRIILILGVFGSGVEGFSPIGFRLGTPATQTQTQTQSIRSSSSSSSSSNSLLLQLPLGSSVPRSSFPGPTRGRAQRNSLDEIRRFVASPADDSGDFEQPSSCRRSKLENGLSAFTFFTPLWTILATLVATWNAPVCARVVGSLPVMQKAYASLMFVMGLTVTPKDFKRAASNPFVLSVNALLCFGLMPLLACCIARGLSYSSNQTAGLVLLASVGGGQASNLFTLIARGDVALSVICTISTTLLGVVSTPLLVKKLLGCAIDVDGRGILASIASLVLVPLFAGSSLARIFPGAMQKVSPFLPTLGVLSTLVLVAGGSSNSVASAVSSLATGHNGSFAALSLSLSLLLPSCLLSCLGGAFALCATNVLRLDETTKRALVIETLSKSPTLAYVLARKHFPPSVADIPAGAMVTLAVVGALIASVWSTTIESEDPLLSN